MRTFAFVLAILGVTLPAFALKSITVAELEQRLAADRGKPDADVAQQLSEFELAERLSTATLTRLELNSPGTKTSEELRILADQSAFLSLPAAEIPSIPAPDVAAQRKMMGLVVNYVSKAIHQLPNFYATRVTTHFEETPQTQTEMGGVIQYRPLHETNAFKVAVLYRDGQEVVDAGKDKPRASKQQGKGLSDWGVFGPILSTVFLDAAKSNLSWSHWEQTPTGTQAVFRYVVPLGNSHYRANYCCLSDQSGDLGDPLKPFDRIVGYRGEIAVDPNEGSILRLTVQADLKPADPISRADIMVEYGPVEIGGQRYICATRSVALSTALLVGRVQEDGQVIPGPPQRLLNDVAFEQYHLFRSDTRILTGDQAGASPASQSSERAADQDSPPSSVAPASPVSLGEASQPSPGGPLAAPASLPVPQAAPTGASGAAPIDQAPLFKTTTHEVVVDVVATKSDGNPVLGLGKQDFEIRENGKPQTIDFFEEHTKGGAVPKATPEMPAMPAGARTNVPPAPPSDAVNVLLIDTLNTEMQDQASVRRQVMDFLTKMQPGTKMAIFVLGSKLRCIQGFTSDSSALLAALHDQRNGLNIQKNPILQTRSDRASDAADISMLQTMQASPYAIDALRSALADAGARNFGARASMTFEALMYLGHSLAGIPGRKNLIWFAGSFPLVIFPTADQLAHLKQNPNVPGYADRVKMTTDLFTVSKIAVYPISAEGLMTEHFGEADSAGPGSAGGVGHIGSQADSVMSPYNAGANERADTIHAMERLATSTGGKAYYNSNDLDAALRQAIDDGANYYTIGYSPADTKMDGSYRQIEVKPAQGRYKLSYRRGYNADDRTTPAAQSNADPLAPLLQPGLPGATGVLYGVRAERASVQPSSGEDRAGQNPTLRGPVTRYTVDFVIRGQDLVLRPNPQGGKSGKFLLGLKAYDQAGNALNWEGDVESLDVSPDQLDSVRQNGIPDHLNIDLPAGAGKIHLVTAVYDLDGGIAGTLEIPLQAAGTASRPTDIKKP